MWNSILGINSFVIAPLCLLFLVYTGVRAIFFWQWKFFWIALVLFIVVLIAEVVLAIMSD